MSLVEGGADEFEEQLLDVPVGVELEGAIGRFAKELDGLVGLALGDAVRRTAELRPSLRLWRLSWLGLSIGRWSGLLMGSVIPRRGSRPSAGSLERWRARRWRCRASWCRCLTRARRSLVAPYRSAHVDRLARCNSPQRAEVFGEAEAMLVADAIELGVR